MPNPWDPFPFPLVGDENSQDTYAGIGRVASEWENIEFSLARLYSLFVGEPDSASGLQAYGKGNIYRDRRIALQRVAAEHFVKRPNQKLEGKFDSICTTTNGFADRRNEVVHGIVVDAVAFRYLSSRLKFAEPGKKQFIVVPPVHSVRNYSTYEGLPEWAYSAKQMAALAERFQACFWDIEEYREGLMTGRPRG